MKICGACGHTGYTKNYRFDIGILHHCKKCHRFIEVTYDELPRKNDPAFPQLETPSSCPQALADPAGPTL